MTLPDQPGGTSITPGQVYAVTNDGSIPGLTERTQENVIEALKVHVQTMPAWQDAHASVFEGLPPGTPLALGLITVIARALMNNPTATWPTITAAIEDIPIIGSTLGNIIEVITGVEDGDESDLGTWVLNLNRLLANPDLSSSTWDYEVAAQQFVEQNIAPLIALLNPLLGIEENEELLANGEFEDAISMGLATGWTWDDTTGYTDPGCAKASPTGGPMSLRSNPIRVAEGQLLNLSERIKWSGVTATGEAFLLNVIPYLGATEGTILTIDSLTNPATTEIVWQLLGDPVWPVPAGMDAIKVQIMVQNTNGGSVWHDNVSCKKTTLLQQQSAAAYSGMNETLDRIYNALMGLVGSGRTHDNLTDAMFASAEANAAAAARLSQLEAAAGPGNPDSDAFERSGAL